MIPSFPQFKPIQLEDRIHIHQILAAYQPQTSELTFTNLFIWRSYYGFRWSMYKDWLCIIGSTDTHQTYALPPIGPPSRVHVTRELIAWLKDEKKQKQASIERADTRLVSELSESKIFTVEPIREHYDYVYRSSDLTSLAGKKYHAKRNYISKFQRTFVYTYEPLTDTHIRSCLELIEVWCGQHRCVEDMNLFGEWEAVGEALVHFNDLELHGGVILIDGKVEAFTLGELLNDTTAVVHVEKTNPEMRELYAVINQKFVEQNWRIVPYINREQDLGKPGLRKAKLSYYPDHLVEKFRIMAEREEK
jgi:hypothetical protein